MSFVLSKIAWALLQPGNILLILIALGALLHGRGWRRAGNAFLVGTVGVLAILAVTPAGFWMLFLLEDRFPPLAEPPAHVDGIIVLGGAVSPILTDERGQTSVNHAAERLLAVPELARRFPTAKIVFAGGSGLVLEQRLKEAPVAESLWRSIGFDTSRVLFESDSRNTWENALNSQRLVAPTPGQTWLLVTSAAHMPRAIGIFRKVGWPMVAYPVDFNVPRRVLTRPQFDLVSGLAAAEAASREWIGLIAYHAMGRTSDLFPAPDP